MLRLLPKQPLVRWALGSVAVVGAGSLAYFLLFPQVQPPTELVAPAEFDTPAELEETADPEILATPAEAVASEDLASLADPAEVADPALAAAQTALPAPSALTVDPGAGALPPEDTAPEMQIGVAAPLDDLAPSFDLVRVTELGDVLIAGRAPASSAVAALIDEDSVAQTVSSRAGEFVMLFALDPHPDPRVLELEVRLASGDRVRSRDTLMLAPRSPEEHEGTAPDGLAIDRDAPQPRQMARAVEGPVFPDSAAPARPGIIPDPSERMPRAPGPEQDSASLPDSTLSAGRDIIADPTQDIAHAPDLAQGSADRPDSAAPARPGIIPDPADEAAPEPGPASAEMPALAAAGSATRADAPPMAMLLRADGGVQVLGPAPRLPGAQTSANVTIDSVVYDAEGEIAISGRSQDGASDIQIYLDNQPILRARATADGNWQAQLAGIERGVYRLRVDELDATAQVISRAEIPFERVTPEIARTASGPQALIVQPGNTLWGLSEQQFGEGWRYMRIFNANRDQIRNPDLIFPGQVFVLPEQVE